jgi:hypothetical protein
VMTCMAESVLAEWSRLIRSVPLGYPPIWGHSRISTLDGAARKVRHTHIGSYDESLRRAAAVLKRCALRAPRLRVMAGMAMT